MTENEMVLEAYVRAVSRYERAPAEEAREYLADCWRLRDAVLARMCGPGEVVISRASLATLFASYCREKEPPENFNVVVMPQYGADPRWIVQAWGDVHDKLAARPNNGGNDDQGK